MREIISVIVPIYNSERTLKRCVESIQNSKYTELDIILVNDGSTDSSEIICDEFSSLDNRIRAFHLKNGGVSKARNFGLQKAEGDFIAFIDSDDYIEEDYFEELRATLLSQNNQLAVGSIAYINGEEKDEVYSHEGQVSLKNSSDADRMLFFELNKLFLLYGPVNKLYLKKVIEENKIVFPEDTSFGEDLLFNVKYLKCIDTLSYRKKPIYYYVKTNENSLSHKYRKDRFENGLRLNLSLKYLLEELGFWQEEEQKYIYGRIFDDAYNAIFDLWNKECNLSNFQKLKRVNWILTNQEVRNACNIADIEDYSKLYTFLMKKNKGLTMFILREIIEKFYHR